MWEQGTQSLPESSQAPMVLMVTSQEVQKPRVPARVTRIITLQATRRLDWLGGGGSSRLQKGPDESQSALPSGWGLAPAQTQNCFCSVARLKECFDCPGLPETFSWGPRASCEVSSALARELGSRGIKPICDYISPGREHAHPRLKAPRAR